MLNLNIKNVSVTQTGGEGIEVRVCHCVTILACHRAESTEYRYQVYQSSYRQNCWSCYVGQEEGRIEVDKALCTLGTDLTRTNKLIHNI